MFPGQALLHYLPIRLEIQREMQRNTEKYRKVQRNTEKNTERNTERLECSLAEHCSITLPLEPPATLQCMENFPGI